MLRLIHFADLHLGVETHGQFRPDLGHSSRIQDFLDAFDQIIDAAIEERFDAVLFAGDAYKHAEPSPTLQRRFAERIQRLLAAGIPIVLLVGNHDRPRSVVRSTPIDIYAALRLPGVIVANRPERFTIATPSGPLQVVALPWIPPRLLLADDALREAGTPELERRYKEVIASALAPLLAALDAATPAVFLGHLSMEGGRFGSERSVILGNDPLFGLDELGLNSAPIDYVALGHLHSHQVLHERPPVVYAGSVERIDFGEEREDKGYVAVRIAAGPYPRDVSWEFRPLRTRPMRTFRLDILTDTPMDEIRRALERHATLIPEAIVRVTITTTPEHAAAMRPLEVRRWLSELGAAHVAGITVQTERVARPRVELERSSRHDPVSLLERWVNLHRLSDQLAKAVIQRGREIIERVESRSSEPR